MQEHMSGKMLVAHNLDRDVLVLTGIACPLGLQLDVNRRLFDFRLHYLEFWADHERARSTSPHLAQLGLF